MVIRKRKYESGTATAYMSRNKAIKKLQLSLPDFRRLCILKGIYPHEPKHKKKANKGSTAPKTFYFVKDIQFLSHEPILAKFRETKHFVKRLKKAIEKKNSNAVRRIRANRPKYKLDHVVKERYPTFVDALRDTDDCLSMCSLFATFPKSSKTHVEFIQLCRRLTVEFMHFVIASKSLRKVFISIKGIYYQAEFQGQTITWVTPHRVGFQGQVPDVDFKIMQIFVEFYTTLLGFINYKLYSSLNIHYPPQLALDGEKNEDDTKGKCLESEQREERLAAFTQSLQTIGSPDLDDHLIDDFPTAVSDDPDMVEKAQVEAENMKRLQSLFKGCKFFLNREVPRETLTFIIRCFGGEVSWFSSVAVGATYQETDETITHQVVDRPKMDNQYLSRYYIQPQWLFDSVNARMLLPVEDYFIGEVLPPHLSPFVDEDEGDYIPPEKQKILDKQKGVDSGVGDESEEEEDEDDEDEEEEEGEESDEEEEGEDNEDEEEEEADDDEESGEEDDGEEEEEESRSQAKKRKKSEPEVKKAKSMSVQRGRVEDVDVNAKLVRQEAEERRLAEMMIPKKKKRLYQKIMYKRKKQKQETRVLQEKREKIEKAAKQEKKKKKKTT
ncbi:pescadillo-like [Haliotis rufescens]|uniref:pescadillo-like n=1 Tax=Haliotis rufescens TaxID=6454 RepID=UPI001EB03B60|nr:pescadillo-like [Haliotis rufescens]